MIIKFVRAYKKRIIAALLFLALAIYLILGNSPLIVSASERAGIWLSEQKDAVYLKVNNCSYSKDYFYNLKEIDLLLRYPYVIGGAYQGCVPQRAGCMAAMDLTEIKKTFPTLAGYSRPLALQEEGIAEAIRMFLFDRQKALEKGGRDFTPCPLPKIKTVKKFKHSSANLPKHIMQVEIKIKPLRVGAKNYYLLDMDVFKGGGAIGNSFGGPWLVSEDATVNDLSKEFVGFYY